MKYKNIDIAIENLRKFKTSKVYANEYPKFFEFYMDKSKNEKSYFFKIGYYRLIVSIDRLIEARMAQVETEIVAMDKPLYKKIGSNTISKLLD